MHLSLSSLLLLGISSLVSSSSLTITIPVSSPLPNPHVLPATTHATLTTLPFSSKDHILSASLTRSASFVFHDLPSSRPDAQPESYLLDIRSAGEYVFAPYRVDVAADGTILGVWETFRGNPWDNRGAVKYVVDVAAKKQVDVVVEAKVIARRAFYEERAKFSPLSLVKNPMILLAIVAMGLMFGMPKLMENMDPEMRAEFEQHSRSSPISGATNNAMAGGGFDLAGWMAGTSANPTANTDAAQSGATGRDTSGPARRRG
ncbi:uncharacterized protein N7446_009922 [Penicillium canescens]|uniref:ER membrane protein complex subunit 7 beta-sandwich domain-containing protein n=1 Tax=Penicillium canescens TaxID=5083 RepID=A0AAD6I812_PENCN|nr:uncharacterized protein N7446_009922 [Penicillium canescens]KAJ6035163.1 hypothetical protein N7460_009338 [Penicillium canescens]KAJ6046821.1 hypothetical protein N7444_008075 [Penicillium canescens]KAJ6053910.1 hypothetical protein N7446_009922 [Penicillium canescens]KAJ6165994.1 hypothetical protein N7485_009238 [Penicillium canescens]